MPGGLYYKNLTDEISIETFVQCGLECGKNINTDLSEVKEPETSGDSLKKLVLF